MGAHFQTPQIYINATAVDFQGLPMQMGQSGINGWTFHNVWTGTLAATLTVEASNDPALTAALTIGDPTLQAAAIEAANWHDITGDVTMTNPTSGGGSDMVIINNARFWWIRLDCNVTGGTGTFTSFTASHGSG